MLVHVDSVEIIEETCSERMGTQA